LAVPERTSVPQRRDRQCCVEARPVVADESVGRGLGDVRSPDSLHIQEHHTLGMARLLEGEPDTGGPLLGQVQEGDVRKACEPKRVSVPPHIVDACSKRQLVAFESIDTFRDGEVGVLAKWV